MHYIEKRVSRSNDPLCQAVQAKLRCRHQPTRAGVQALMMEYLLQLRRSCCLRTSEADLHENSSYVWQSHQQSKFNELLSTRKPAGPSSAKRAAQRYLVEETQTEYTTQNELSAICLHKSSCLRPYKQRNCSTELVTCEACCATSSHTEAERKLSTCSRR